MLRRHPVRFAIAAIVVALGIGAVAYGSGRRPPGYEHQIRVACHDARALQRASMLDEAHAAYERIGRLDHGRLCRPLVPGPAAYRRWAASYAEFADGYLRAARLKSDAPNTTALQHSANALVTSVALDPFGSSGRDDFQRVMTELGQPRTRVEANEDCARAGRLRAARLLDEAEVMYARALRSGRHTRCVSRGLRKIRTSAGLAHRNVLAAASLQANGHAAEARRSYLQALRRDRSLTEAREAVQSLPAPKLPRSSNAGWAMDWTGSSLDWLGSLVRWLTQRAAAIAVVAVAVAVVIWLGMLGLLASTRWPWWRRQLDKRPSMRRFTRTRMRVAKFTPEDKAGSCEGIFTQYLSAPPIRAGDDEPDVSSVDQYVATEQPSDRVDISTVLQTLPYGNVLAAVATWIRENAPRREAHLNGHLLLAGPDRFGLRVVAHARNGASYDSATFWSADLPGPAFEAGDADAAQTALAIVAAAWAYETVSR